MMAREEEGGLSVIRRLSVGLVGLLVLGFGAGCAGEYVRQPSDWSSFIVCYDGGTVYDDELAAMAQVLMDEGPYTSSVFVFTQCNSGGMLDDLVDALAGRGDVALLSASRHDEAAWRAVTTDSMGCLARSGLERPEAYFASVVARALDVTGDDALTLREVWELARDEGAARPGGPATQRKICPGPSWVDPPEHAQWVALGRGAELRLGFDADGGVFSADSRHALLFVGDGDSIADWNDLEVIYTVLMGHGFAPDRVLVLAGPGPEADVLLQDPEGFVYHTPGFVDAPGTREALLRAPQELSGATGSEAQLLVWVGGHGGNLLAFPWASALELPPDGVVWSQLTQDSNLLGDGSPYELFVFEGGKEDRVTVTMTSKELDAYLWLYDDERQVVARDDDSGGGTNARLEITLPGAGTYYVLANAYAEGEVGGYRLQVRIEKAAGPVGAGGASRLWG